MTQPSPQNLPEQAFATALGMAREDIKKLRAELLAPSIDWSGGGGLPVVIHPSGQSIVISALEKNRAEKKEEDGGAGEESLAAAVAEATSADRWEVLVVARVGKNKRLLEAEAQGEGVDKPRLTVRVKDTSRFVKGMVLERCERSGTPGFYYYQGRQPRKKGQF